MVDIDEVARYLGTTPQHITRLVKYRQIPYTKVGLYRRFDLNVIDRWLDENAREAKR
jgi:excisionase family DNA binding protein